ncbi:MAG TPA: VacJ family lipoprotein [Rhizomicrobium sp.]|nr:VacJ family lipoprotein [Rhizomicrobium sp.]
MSISAFVAAAGLLLSACASDPEGTAVNDPFENTNRQVFAFDQKLDRYVLAPVAQGYVDVVPDPARDGIHNFLLNLDLPVTFVNDLLQGEGERAAQDFARFAMNSTFGIGGLFDPATGAGIPYNKEDFGQTLGTWGVGEGPYLVLPFLGPDPPRDATGQIVDIFFDPTTYISLREHFYYSAGRQTLWILDLRSRNLGTMDQIERSSVDYYASVRSLYRQKRNNDIRNGKPDLNNLPDL